MYHRSICIYDDDISARCHLSVWTTPTPATPLSFSLSLSLHPNMESRNLPGVLVVIMLQLGYYDGGAGWVIPESWQQDWTVLYVKGGVLATTIGGEWGCYGDVIGGEWGRSNLGTVIMSIWIGDLFISPLSSLSSLSSLQLFLLSSPYYISTI